MDTQIRSSQSPDIELHAASDGPFRKHGKKVTFAYTIISFISAASIQLGTHWLWKSFTIILTVSALITLCRCTQTNPPDKSEGHYTAPYVPLLPAIGIYFNYFLCWELDLQTWVNLLVYSVMGLIIYFGYGIKNSKV